jgi:hypothetical protein
MDAQGRSFLLGCSWTVIFGRTLLHAQGRSFLEDVHGRLWTLMNGHFFTPFTLKFKNFGQNCSSRAEKLAYYCMGNPKKLVP